ncbi:guanine nucleotide exchange factor subunit RIC1-like [Halichondria panicea]|uniref:guanine nucleotide exchange factor subunit RIC1-like n=1 Tax=Halichondria panicea TaxID=6063 RepID=UPI00312B70BF
MMFLVPPSSHVLDGTLFRKLLYRHTTPTSLLHHGAQPSSEGRSFETVTISFITETAVVGGITSLVNVSGGLVVATGYGMLHRVSWDGRFDGSLQINLSLVPFTTDLLPETRGTPLGDSSLHATQLAYSLDMHGLSLVLSDGRGVFLTSRSSRLEPQEVAAVSIPGLTGATCSALNGRYRLVAFGKEDGSVDVYSLDDSNGSWSISHSLKFSRSQFPETGLQLGSVVCVEWSVGDGMVVGVAWSNGGLSLWTVFGSLLLCSHGDQPGTPSPLNPHCTVLQSICWSSDMYHLWMLAKTATEHTSSEKPTNQSGVSNSNGGQVIVMGFMKNAIVNNPISVNHSHLFLLGSDRLCLNLCKVTTPTQTTGEATPAGTSAVSSPQWRVVQYPSSYMALNWPVKYAAVNAAGSNLVIAGRAGFALYSGSRRKWKLFGNEVQEQSLVCRGGVLWYQDIVVFPCRVQEHSEEVRFYSLHSNLDNSQLMHSLKSTSPTVKINLHGDCLLLASRDCHMTIMGLSLTTVPTQGLVLNVTKLREVSLAKSLPIPWATTLVSMTLSNIRTDPSTPSHPHTGIPSGATQNSKIGTGAHPQGVVGSVLFNVSGRLLMTQQETPSVITKENSPDQIVENRVTFSSPVCLAGSVEAVWTPPYHAPSHTHHLMESLWLACGAAGIKVWLPLYPRDEGHPTFLSKRIMLTLPITVYPQVVLFSDAIMFGLSHETAFTDSAHPSRHAFPFATIERTTHVFLHHILRQLLRRNLGSHALQMARSSSHLPYFRHVLELMLHEILEEEAPRSRSMPVPDALLPCGVEFIKQFPEFLETVGHCARKTEIALWQYLFAAIGSPRDLFELCMSDGRLSTAATYLIIIQNLEAAAVSRQLATKLLDASLDANQWELCTDLVRFLKTIACLYAGTGDTLDSPLMTMATTPRKTPTPTPTRVTLPPLSTEGGPTPTSAGPDLDRSAMSLTRDHLTSGGVANMVSLSGEYKDASGKVIRRPQFVMDVDSKEDFFIELILCRHARKLLTSTSLRDLGKFTAQLDFNLSTWLAKERLRAARIDDFVTTLRDVHKEFLWPLPPFDDTHTFSPASTIRGQSSPPSSSAPDTPTKSNDVTLGNHEGEVPPAESTIDSEGLASSLKRANRPPDLDLTPAHAIAILRTASQGQSTIDSLRGNSLIQGADRSDFDPTRSSTPSKRSGSFQSERVSLIMKPNSSSADLNTGAENSSLGDIMEESDWELNSVVAMATGENRPPVKGSSQAEKEIRYFADVMLSACCVEWGLVLAVLLLDASLVNRVVQEVKVHPSVDAAVLSRVTQGYEELCDWADNECPGYSQFLLSLSPHFEQLSLLARQHDTLSSTTSDHNTPLNSLTFNEDSSLPPTEIPHEQIDGLLRTPQSSTTTESNCVLS